MLAVGVIALLVGAQPQVETVTGDRQGELARVDGRVIDAVSGEPIARAVVRLIPVVERLDRNGNPVLIVANPDANPTFEVRTASDGAFLVRAPEGTYGLEVRHGGYAPWRYGQDAGGVTPDRFRLEGTRGLTGLTIPLARLGVIAGRVFDEQGEPQVGVPVHTFRAVYAGGRRRYQLAHTVETDDLGAYRVSDLERGNYVVAVLPGVASTPRAVVDSLAQRDQDAERLSQRLVDSGGIVPDDPLFVGQHAVSWLGATGRLDRGTDASSSRVSVYEAAFYPGVPDAGRATGLEIDKGSELAGIDLVLRLVPSLTVSGRIVGPDEVRPHAGVRLLRSGDEALLAREQFASGVTVADADGRFSFLGIPPGDYVAAVMVSPRMWAPPASSARSLLTAVHVEGSSFWTAPRSTDDRLWWARERITVADSDVSNVELNLVEGARVSGRIRFEGSEPPASRELSSVSVRLVALDDPLPSRISVTSSDDGTFVSPRYPPGRYRVAVGLPGSRWRTLGVLLNGVDVQDSLLIADRDIDGITVVLTNQETWVSGSVLSAVDNEPAARTAVVLPGDIEEWIQSGMSPSAARVVPVLSSRFTVRNLRPGRCLIAALPGAENVALDDPDFVRAIAAGAEVVNLKAGENAVSVRTLRRR